MRNCTAGWGEQVSSAAHGGRSGRPHAWTAGQWAPLSMSPSFEPAPCTDGKGVRDGKVGVVVGGEGTGGEGGSEGAVRANGGNGKLAWAASAVHEGRRRAL